MGFKEQIQADLNIFINDNEFAEPHTIDGVQLSVVIDNDRLKERQSHSEYGYEGDILFFVAKSAYGAAPASGQVINFDGDIYRVTNVQDDLGMYSITLAGNMS